MILVEDEEYLLLVSFSMTYRASRDEKNKDRLAYYITDVGPSTLGECIDEGAEVRLRDGDTLDDFCIKVAVNPLPSHVQRPSIYPPEAQKPVQVVYQITESRQD
ncbi:hypothetical protein KY362_05615 [Candidatus Woesearchaeota archaeon]|nr:hypothetical protein [Candidatus Woesearchaeota archaeon]